MKGQKSLNWGHGATVRFWPMAARCAKVQAASTSVPRADQRAKASDCKKRREEAEDKGHCDPYERRCKGRNHAEWREHHLSNYSA